jgi:biopolymer transport protein ExbD
MDVQTSIFDSPYAGLFPRQQRHQDAEFDITAMVDLVFMMNIFFLVTFVGAVLSDINLPAAAHVKALDAEPSIVITVLPGRSVSSVDVYLGEGKNGTPIQDPDDQASQIAAAVEAGLAQGKKAVLIRAEKGIRLREINRLAAAATAEGVTLHIAVMEKDVGK